MKRMRLHRMSCETGRCKKNVNIDIVQMDVTREDEVNHIIDQVTQKHNIDVLVNNAGVMPTGITEGFSLQQMRAHFDVNFFGAVCDTRSASADAQPPR